MTSQQSASTGEPHWQKEQLAPADIIDALAVAEGSESREQSRPSCMISNFIMAGCVAGAALEVALEAPSAVTRRLLGQPKPADACLAVCLVRQATSSVYGAAGLAFGLADVTVAATGALGRFLF